MASDNLTRTVVSILGQEYRLKGTEPEPYVKRLAAYVDAKLRQIVQKNPHLPLGKAAVMAAILIADEYHKLQEDYEGLMRLIEEEKRGRGGVAPP
ncbi:MAG: cell division protein ZapA [Clostridia bacterium]|nr:cell division protein ZapA [Clostridia bacterium]MBC7345893.1 cell division protein ZapA [Clostridia bacterium]